MDDEELLLKVAVIAGFRIHRGWLEDGRGVFIRAGNAWKCWNPLEDKAQAFELVEKYRLSILFDEPEWIVSRRFSTSEYVDGGSWSGDPSLPRAICLAIVEAKCT